jgi:outer membrane receptor for ferrienterochelin and colicins
VLFRSIFAPLTLTLGLRYDDHDTVGDNFSPRAYVVWNADPRWTLKGGVSRGFKTPALNSFYDGINGVSGQGTIFSYGNPNLKAETSTSYELGAIFDLKSKLSAGITGFYTKFKDMLGTEPNPQDPRTNWPVNVDEAESYGFETFVSYDFTKKWTLATNYTWTQSEYKSGSNAGRPFVNTPKHSINTRLRWKATSTLSFWLSGEYRSKRYRGTDTTGLADALGDYKDYAISHLGASWKASERFTLNATINNLFDKDFVDYESYLHNGNNIRYAGTYANIYEGRRLWVSAILNF